MNIVPLRIEKIDVASEVLVDSFSDDPIFKYIFKSNNEYFSKAPWLFSSWIEWAIMFGNAWITEDEKAVLLTRAKGNGRMSLSSMIKAGMLNTPFKLGLSTFNRFYFNISSVLESKHASIMGEQDHMYGWMVGTKKSNPGNGKFLINHIIRLAEKDNLAIFLETSTQRNVRLYELLKWKLKEQVFLPQPGITIYFMVREPRLTLHPN